MSAKKRTKSARGPSDPGGGGKIDDGTPKRRTCSTEVVHQRLMRTMPGYAEARARIETQTWRATRFGMVARTGCTKISVVVHVIFKNDQQNISDAQVSSQIDVLNADFRKKNTDISKVPAPFAPLAADARIEFVLATEDPSGTATSGITRTRTNVSAFSDDDAMKSQATGGADAWPRDRYLNVWVCQLGGGLLGYAQFPGGPADTDGVVILHSAFGTTGTAAAPFDQGRTAVHEVGHWLNLRHIWGDDGTGCSGSDFVADTPNQGGANLGKPSFPRVTCNNGPNGDMFMNYMDYVDDDSMFMFTTGQVDRMQATLDGARSTLGTTIPCDDLGVPTLPDPSIKFRDDQPKPIFDGPGSPFKFVDDPPKPPFDVPGSLKFLEDPGSLKFLDDLTNPFQDPIKMPFYDKNPISDLGNIFGSGPLINPPDMFGGRGVPFVLSTPHHSSAWQQSFPGAAQHRVAQLQQALATLHQQIQAVAAVQGQRALSPQEAAAAQQLHAEWSRVLMEYQQMAGGEG